MEIGRSVMEYAVYDKYSTSLNRLSSAEVKKLTPEQLVNAWKNLAKFAPIYHFVGTTEGEDVKKILQNAFGKTFGATHLDAKNLRLPKTYTENTILFLNNKKARQTQLHFYVLGNNYSVAEAPKQEAFNSYFGEDMSSLMFQEIREFRSLAYTASGMYRRPLEMKDKGYFAGYIGCQADKTLESMDIMNELLQKMPEKPERMDEIRSGLIMQVPAARPSFRNMSANIDAWLDFGYKEDPMKSRMPVYPTLQFSDILDFYAKNVKGKPVVVAITGNKSKINMAKLAKFGKIVEVDMKTVYKK
jgi:predicted Zn-dependent peptidase